MKRQFSVLALLLAASGTARAQENILAPPNTYLTIPAFAAPAPQATPKREPSGLDEIIRARFPLAVMYRDFGAGWRIIDFYGGRYYTKGETTWINNIEQLVCYVPTRDEANRKLSQLDKKDYIVAAIGNAVPFKADDRFSLTLVPLRNLLNTISNGQTGIRSFDASDNRTRVDARNFFESFNQNLSLLYLRKIHQALESYSQTYLNVLPDLSSAFDAKQALLPFAENEAIFTRPGTDEPFKFNAILSGKKREHVRRKRSLIVAYEARPAADGLRAVLLLSGTAQRIDERAWNKLSQRSDLP